MWPDSLTARSTATRGKRCSRLRARVIANVSPQVAFTTMPTDSNALKIANDSGFPLQIAVATQVTQSTMSHGWKVRHTEHSWVNRTDHTNGFIDLVLQDKHGSTFLVVECKRKNETWVFMHADGTENKRRHAKAWASHYVAGSMKRFGWANVTPDPFCPEAIFCAVRGQSASDKTTMLERIGGELISATEALAQEERDFRRANQETIRFYFNVVVTTAELKIATFSPGDISLSTGTLADAQIESVPFVRFRKQLSTRERLLTPEDVDNGIDVAYEKENTIFVVRANELLQFLRQFELPDDEFRMLKHGG